MAAALADPRPDERGPGQVAGSSSWSFTADGPDRPGVLVLHGFTGHPDSMRPVAEATAAAGFHVELPLLPGHGTQIADMVPTRWSDWLAEADAARGRLAERSSAIVVAGLSMGGSLALTLALDHAADADAVFDEPAIVGLVLVNPATRPRPADVRELVVEALADGMAIYPGAAPAADDPPEVGYPDTPLAALLSFLDDGLGPLAERLADVAVPVLLFTSRLDDVVPPADSEQLAAEATGPVDHRWLESAGHTATLDPEGVVIPAEAVAFVGRVTGAVR